MGNLLISNLFYGKHTYWYNYAKIHKIHIWSLRQTEDMKTLFNFQSLDHVQRLPSEGSWPDPTVLNEAPMCPLITDVAAQTQTLGSSLRVGPEPSWSPSASVPLLWPFAFAHTVVFPVPVCGEPSEGIISLLSRHVIHMEDAGKPHCCHISSTDRCSAFLIA